MSIKSISGIYKIESLDGKVYIGSAVDMHKRWYGHKSALNNNKHHSTHLQKSWNKNGADYFKFSVLEVIQDTNRLLHYEQIWLNILFSSLDKKKIYNELLVAGSCLGRKFTQKTKDKMSKTRTGRKHPIGHKVGLNRIQSYTLVSPDGKTTHITNMREFCRNNGLSASHMVEVANGKRKSSKGWKHV